MIRPRHARRVMLKLAHRRGRVVDGWWEIDGMALLFAHVRASLDRVRWRPAWVTAGWVPILNRDAVRSPRKARYPQRWDHPRPYR